MHQLFSIAGTALTILVVASVMLYAPFAKSWLRALALPFVLTLVWGAVRIASSIFFRESSPPAMGYVVVPFICALYAGIARGIKLVIFKIPALQRLEETVREKLAAKRKD